MTTKKPKQIAVPDRYFTKGAVVTLASFLGVLGPLGALGWNIIKGVSEAQTTLTNTQNTIDEHTRLIKQEFEDFKDFKIDFNKKVDADNQQRDALRSAFMDNATKTAQGIADLNTRAVKTETAQTFMNQQLGEIVTELKDINKTVQQGSQLGHR